MMGMKLEELLISQVTIKKGAKKLNGFNIYDRTEIDRPPKFLERIEDVADYLHKTYRTKQYPIYLNLDPDMHIAFNQRYDSLD